jgi:feruloyl esterase
MKFKLMKWRRIAVAVSVAGMFLSMTAATTAAAQAKVPAAAQAAPALTASAATVPVASCASLAVDNFSGVKDEPSQITSAADVTEDGIQYCDVKGVISPQTDFEMLLPESTYQGAYLQEGCGGFCGAVTVSPQPAAATGCAPVTAGQFAIATDDEGHEAGATDGLWAANDPTLRVVFAYTSEHSLAQLAKAVIAVYYGSGPKYSYFDGCSDGGREALEEAQRYPRDFNGILAGSAANNWTAAVGMEAAWDADINTAPNGTEILPLEKLPALHAAVMKACADAQGVIVDPRQCTFNPASVQCPAGTDNDTCLTPAQVTVAREAYRGPTDPQGRNLYDGGEPYGSELAWVGWFVDPASDTAFPADTADYQFAINYLEYMAYPTDPPSSFTLSDFKFTDATYAKLQQLAGLYNATDPDLSAFERAGGKLIIYGGWADQAVTPWPTLDYYSAVANTMGGYAATQQFSRLYMVPGGYHCLGGGDPSVTADFLTPLVNWVQDGVAPSAVVLPVLSQTTGTTLTSLTVEPLNPTTPAPHNDGLNSNYHYIGIKSAYQAH